MTQLPPLSRLNRRSILRGATLLTIGAALRSLSVESAEAATVTYQVQPGDTLGNVSTRFGVSIADLAAINNLVNPNFLRIGQLLTIGSSPAPSPSAPPSSAPAASPTAPPTPATAPAPGVPNVVGTALTYLGRPYAWGGTSPWGFDCSGFAWYVYRQAGRPIPRDLWGQLQSGSRVPRSALQPGDLVFFAGTYERGLSHVGIYLGGNRFVHSEDYGIGVTVSDLAGGYWGASYYAACRPGT